MRFKEGDRIVYNGKKIVRGIIFDINPNGNVVIEWEGDRKTVHTRDQLNLDDLPLIQIELPNRTNHENTKENVSLL